MSLRLTLRFLGMPDPAEHPNPDRVKGRAGLRRALQALPRRERQVVTLRFLFEVSVAEIALLLGIQPNSVEQTLLRGLAHLRAANDAAALDRWVPALREHGGTKCEAP